MNGHILLERDTIVKVSIFKNFPQNHWAIFIQTNYQRVKGVQILKCFLSASAFVRQGKPNEAKMYQVWKQTSEMLLWKKASSVSFNFLVKRSTYYAVAILNFEFYASSSYVGGSLEYRSTPYCFLAISNRYDLERIPGIIGTQSKNGG